MKVLVTGGAGYIGAMLVPFLLADGHHVTVCDPMWFGDGNLPSNDHLTVMKDDLRKSGVFLAAIEGQDAVIYLASISNNDMIERDVRFANAINLTALGDALYISNSFIV